MSTEHLSVIACMGYEAFIMQDKHVEMELDS